MIDFFLALILLSLFIPVHLLMCRKFSSKHHLGIHFKMCMITLLLYWGAQFFLACNGFGEVFGFEYANNRLVISSMIFLLLGETVYIVFFINIDNSSPATDISVILRGLGGKGTYLQLREKFSDEKYVETRLNDLLYSGLVELRKSNKIALTSRGFFLARLLNFYQSFFGRPVGG